ncbi:MAG: hypothetical protein GXP37_15785 [Chloroflexi bacterium]|nr:hypothetical protein [Chloroflexota bacterium]
MIKNTRLSRIPADTWLRYLVLMGLLAYLLAQFVASLSWRMVHDTPLLSYMAFLIDRYGAVPYRDIYTTDYPGALAFHWLIGRLFGYGDVGFRVVDVLWLTALLAVTWGIMRRFGHAVAGASMVLFALSYFQHGPSMSLQRDYVAILPVAAAVLWALTTKRMPLWLRGAGVGLLFGLAMTIKPPLGIGLPLVWAALVADAEATWPARLGRGIRLGLAMAVGLAVPLTVTFAWLYANGAWPAFLDMTLHYMPLHLGMTGEHKVIRGITRDLYLWRSYGQLGGLGIWLAPAALGLYVALFVPRPTPARKRKLWLMAAMALAYSIEPVFSGQFWPYHWMPFQYFIVILAGLSFRPLPANTYAWGQRLLPLVLVALVAMMAFAPRNEFFRQMTGQPPDAPKGGRVDEIAAYLQAHLTPGDTVQPLDWTGGAVHGMLIAEAPLATPYIYDYYFYHHISSPTIQQLRADFIVRLKAAAPRFIIDVQKSPRPSGRDTTTEFPELRSFMAQHYAPVQSGDGYVIYERQQ